MSRSPSHLVRQQFGDGEEADDLSGLDDLGNVTDEKHEWMPKTEAGVRSVAIHPKLIDVGILELINQRRMPGGGRLFSLDTSGASAGC